MNFVVTEFLNVLKFAGGIVVCISIGIGRFSVGTDNEVEKEVVECRRCHWIVQ